LELPCRCGEHTAPFPHPLPPPPPPPPRLDPGQLDELIARAQRQSGLLEELRVRAAADVIAAARPGN
jgi:hypothetical protein